MARERRAHRASRELDMPHQVEKSGEQQKAAEADVEGFKQALGPFVVAAETSRMPMMFTDAKASGHPVVFVNQAFLTLTGYDEDEVMGRSFYSLMERGTDQDALFEIQTAFDGGRDLDPLVRYRRKDESAIWVTIFISPVRNEQGDVVQHFASFADVTLRKEEEDRLRSRVEELEKAAGRR